METLDQQFHILGVNANYFKIFIVLGEDETSVDSFSDWHIENKIVFVNIKLSVILSRLFFWRIANYANVFHRLLEFVFLFLEKIITKTAKIFFKVLFSVQL